MLSYFTANYPGDTLVKAYKNRDNSYIVFSVANGIFATTFSADGTLINREALHDDAGDVTVLTESALPAAVISYLTTTYPDYVFKQAFSFTENGAVVGYVVGIDANNTKYAIQFDTSGNFVKAITLR